MLLACWPVLLALHLFLDRIMDAWMWMYGSQARDQEAGHPSIHPTTGHLLILFLTPKLSTNPVVDIIRFLTRGCDICETLHQSEAINAHAPGFRDHLALAQCARSGNGGAGCGQVVEGRTDGIGLAWCWQDEGIHGTNYCTCTVRTTPAGFQDSDEPPPRFKTGSSFSPTSQQPRAVIGLSSQPETTLLNADWISSQTVLHLYIFFQPESSKAFLHLPHSFYSTQTSPSQPLF